jgi:hypothetical protein
MISPERQELLQQMAALCDRYPHWRVGQLVANLAGWADAEVWDAEDSQLLAAANAHIEQLPDQEQKASA